MGPGGGGPWSEATEEGVGGGVVRSRAQGGEVVGVRVWGGMLRLFLGPGGGVPGRWRQRPGMDWPSGLGGVGGRGRASTHGAFSWVDKSF